MSARLILIGILEANSQDCPNACFHLTLPSKEGLKKGHQGLNFKPKLSQKRGEEGG